MISIKIAKVIGILEESEEIQIIHIEIQKTVSKAINYPQLTGKVKIEDLVQLNTTAVDLGLGTGGYHFVSANLNTCEKDVFLGTGHIMKMRYTPQQIKVLAVEEQASLYHEQIKSFKSLNNTPVLIGFLHSMIIPAIAGIKCFNENLKLCYIMTDGGALPLSFSSNIKLLKAKKWINSTITSGHAFGGDLEAINIYSALAAAFVIEKPDIIIAAMGPGNVGTGTELGTTALEVGQIINAVHSLGGHPIVIPRISFQDNRNRHQGISHHVITVLNKIALASCTLIVPVLTDENKQSFLKKQIEENNLAARHKLFYENGSEGLNYMQECGFNVLTMGRSLEEDRDYFLAASAAGTFCARLV